MLRRWAKDAKIGLSFPEHLAAIKDACAALLAKAGLPTTKDVEHDGRLSSIAHYVAEVRKFERDSPEDIAARIIELAARLDANPRMAAQIGFQLGKLWSLMIAYAIESAGGRKGGRRTAIKLRKVANERERVILLEAGKLRAVNPYLKDADLARHLSDRDYGGAEALRKLIRNAKKKSG